MSRSLLQRGLRGSPGKTESEIVATAIRARCRHAGGGRREKRDQRSVTAAAIESGEKGNEEGSVAP